MTLTLRPCGGGDLAALSALFEERFGHPLSAEEWEWKYRRLPGEGRSLVAVGPGGRLLAHAGALRLPAVWRGGEGGIWQLTDFVGTTGGGGLRSALVVLGRHLLTGLAGPGDAPWIFGFPSPRHFRLGRRTFGYRPLTEIAPLAGALPATPPAEPGRARPAERLEPGEEWAERTWVACGVHGVRRTGAFLTWRYHDRPARYYRYYRLTAGGDGGRTEPAEGLAVFAFVGREAWAAELWLPPRRDWYDALLAVAADLRRSGLGAWRFWPPPDPGLGPVLARLGLAPVGETRFVGCRAADGGSAPLPAAGDFYYAMGDYDSV